MGVGTDNILGVADHEYMILAVNPKNNTDRTLEGRDSLELGQFIELRLSFSIISRSRMAS